MELAGSEPISSGAATWPAADAGDEEAWFDSDRILLRDLPPLPPRASGYWVEPLCGMTVVGVFSLMFVGMVHAITAPSNSSQAASTASSIALALVWVESAIAALCVAYLVLGGAGVVRRSERTCYPMPAEVERRLRDRRSLEGLQNISGPEGSQTLGSYCVRCLVWRPPSSSRNVAHHCQICSRCVTGFDHHCGVFGRCIVRGNMFCFVCLIAMLPCGFITAFLAIVVGEPTP